MLAADQTRRPDEDVMRPPSSVFDHERDLVAATFGQFIGPTDRLHDPRPIPTENHGFRFRSGIAALLNRRDEVATTTLHRQNWGGLWQAKNPSGNRRAHSLRACFR